MGIIPDAFCGDSASNYDNLYVKLFQIHCNLFYFGCLYAQTIILMTALTAQICVPVLMNYFLSLAFLRILLMFFLYIASRCMFCYILVSFRQFAGNYLSCSCDYSATSSFNDHFMFEVTDCTGACNGSAV